MVSDFGDAIAGDPEARQARMIAEAARTRLVACVSSPEGGIDLAEAQAMLNALRTAQVLAQDAEDRVLLHRGLLTSGAADERAARRRPAGNPRPVRDLRAPRPRLPVVTLRRPAAAQFVAGALVLALLGAIGVTLARRCGVRLPLTPR